MVMRRRLVEVLRSQPGDDEDLDMARCLLHAESALIYAGYARVDFPYITDEQLVKVRNIGPTRLAAFRAQFPAPGPGARLVKPSRHTRRRLMCRNCGGYGYTWE